jgi:diguanylate cyclase (GGDEF)-like protein
MDKNDMDYELNIRDRLTHLYTRRICNFTLEDKLARAIHKQTSIALLYMDVDNFSLFNCHNGHAEGDKALLKIARYLGELSHSSGVPAFRYESDEFLLLLESKPIEAIEAFAASLVSEIESLDIFFNVNLENPNPIPNPHGYLTVSLGIAYAATPSDAINTEKLLSSAVESMCLAKNSGKNRYALAKL